MILNILTWTEAYIKYKDSIQQKISKIEIDDKKKEINCEYKDGRKHTYVCLENLKDININTIDKQKISCNNTKKNFDWLINNWDELKKTDVSIIFANPKKAMHWSVIPKAHNNISDKSTIKKGLKAIYDTIPEI